MARYFINLRYDGTRYHGWQRQPNDPSIQQTIEEAFSTILRSPLQLTGAGRTDTGVHARSMTAHFDLPEPLPMPLSAMVSRLNNLLPPDIAIHHIRPVVPTAHARFDALSRRYEYHVTLEKDPFMHNYAMRLNPDIDFQAMNQAADRLLHYIDFTSFSKLHTDVKTNNCHITQARWQQQGNHWIFIIEADRFLRNMVRAIVGTLLQVGRHKLDTEGFCQIIEKKDRCAAGTSAPAAGLFLVDVKYPETIFIPQE